MGFLVQLEPFDYSSINIDRQALVCDLLFESSCSRDIPAPSINYDCSVKFNSVVNISVNKANDISMNKVNQIMDKFSIKMYKKDKVVDMLFKEVPTLVPLFWTPKFCDIFLCNLALRKEIFSCIYLDVVPEQ